MSTEFDLLTVAEAADALRVTPKTIYNKVRKGELAARRLGSGPHPVLRIRRAELERFLEEGSTRELEVA